MEKKEIMLRYLKKYNRASTTKLAMVCGATYIYAVKYLEELVKRGDIVKEAETNRTYWRIK